MEPDYGSTAVLFISVPCRQICCIKALLASPLITLRETNCHPTPRSIPSSCARDTTPPQSVPPIGSTSGKGLLQARPRDVGEGTWMGRAHAWESERSRGNTGCGRLPD